MPLSLNTTKIHSSLPSSWIQILMSKLFRTKAKEKLQEKRNKSINNREVSSNNRRTDYFMAEKQKISE
jgi:hypothetical protein